MEEIASHATFIWTADGKPINIRKDIENYDSPYQFHSKMNAAANDDTFSDDGKKDNFKDENDLPF